MLLLCCLCQRQCVWYGIPVRLLTCVSAFSCTGGGKEATPLCVSTPGIQNLSCPLPPEHFCLKYPYTVIVNVNSSRFNVHYSFSYSIGLNGSIGNYF